MQNRVDLIKYILEDKKAEDVQVFNMQEKDYFVDIVIIATSLGERHGLSLLDYLKTSLKEKGENLLHVDATGDWVVVDLGDILIHILSENFRAKYNIEEFLKKQEEEYKRLRN